MVPLKSRALTGDTSVTLAEQSEKGVPGLESTAPLKDANNLMRLTLLKALTVTGVS